jgi:uncharacterized Zn finger protein (UPF0148 family)
MSRIVFGKAYPDGYPSPESLRPKPRVLRNLKIEDVSSVDHGAGRGVRVVLMKRDGVAGEAVAALGASVRSILGDAAVVDKRGRVAESVTQCREYLLGKGVDAAAAGAAVAEVIGKLGDGSGGLAMTTEERDFTPEEAMFLATGNKEDKMSDGDYCCPSCGYAGDKKEFKDAGEEASKRYSLAEVDAIVGKSIDSAVREAMADGMSREQAIAKSVGGVGAVNPDWNELHKRERDQKQRLMGNLR